MRNHLEPPGARILHICNWFPTRSEPGIVPFIPRHISSLSPFFQQDVWHVEVKNTGNRWELVRDNPFSDRTYRAEVRSKRWLFIEWLSFLLIAWAWITRDRSKTYDLINFHVAYPNCARLKLLKMLFRKPIVITEHWTAYHRGFGATSKGVGRIKSIFHQHIPVIVVSRALQKDIVDFAGPPQPRIYVVDNVVDPAVFHPSEEQQTREGTFFAIAGWGHLKKPDVLIESLARMRARGWNARLRMAGNGSKLEAMRKQIAQLGMDDHVDLLGQLDENSVALEMDRAHALLHASAYETYSVVTAEALCCGTPVIASDVGALPELIGPGMGHLVPSNEPDEWTRVWSEAWHELLHVDRNAISRRMTEKANMSSVGERYAAILTAETGLQGKGQVHPVGL